MRFSLRCLIAISILSGTSSLLAQSWQNVTAKLPRAVSPTAPILLSDGSVLVHNSCGRDWYKLTPDASGSFVKEPSGPIGSLTVDHSLISNNTAFGGGAGGILNRAGTLTVTHSRITGNTGPGGAAMVTVGHGDTVGTDGGGTGTACERAAIAKTATSKAAATKTATVFFIFGESPGSFESHGKHTILR